MSTLKHTFPLLTFLTFVFSYLPQQLTAQVYIEFEDSLIGKISETTVAQVRVANFVGAGIDIDYHFRGYISTPDGETDLLRVKSELLTQQTGNASFADEHEGPLRTLNKDPFDLTVQYATAGWQNYTGEVRLRVELTHPLDTHSIIARKEQNIWLKNGELVDENGNFATDPNKVRLRYALARDEVFKLEQLLTYMTLTNTNEHPHCGPLGNEPLHIILKQNERVLYKTIYQPTCIPVGETTLRSSDFKVALDEYADRDRQQAVYVYMKRGDHYEGELVLPAQHAQYSDKKTTFNSRALGLTVDHFEWAQASPNFFGLGTLIFDTNEELIEANPVRLQSIQYAFPLDHPQGFSLQRSDVNGAFSAGVYGWNQLSPAQWEAYFVFLLQNDQATIDKQTVGDINIWLPSHYREEVAGNGSPIQFYRSVVAIQDGDRLVLLTFSQGEAPAGLPNFIYPKYRFDEADCWASLRYNGIGFKTVIDKQTGHLMSLSPYQVHPGPTHTERTATYERFQQYATLPQVQQPSWATEPLPKPSLDELDNILATRTTTVPKITPIAVITPTLDTVRQYTQHEWDAARLRFTHRTVEQRNREPQTAKGYEVFSFNASDSLLSVSRSNYLQEDTPPADLTTFSVVSEYLTIWDLPAQNIFVSYFEETSMTQAQLAALTAYENSTMGMSQPSIRITQIGDWTIFASERLSNTMRRFGVGNMVLVKTPTRIYRLHIAGGFRSDIMPFLNSIEIEGKRLQLQYNEAGELVEVDLL